MWTFVSWGVALLTTISFTVMSMPYSPSQNPSIIQLPHPDAPSSATSALNVTNIQAGGWPAEPWTYHDGPDIVKFIYYGEDANETFTKEIIKATLYLQADISKGPDTYKDEAIFERKGPVTFRVIFTGEGGVSKGEIFRILDMWRVYCGVFGARELAFGDLGPAKPWVPTAVFSITFT